MQEDEKKPPVGGGDVVFRARAVPLGQDGQVGIRLEADSDAARELLGDIDVWGHKPVAVVDRARTAERCAHTGGFRTVGLTLVLSR